MSDTGARLALVGVLAAGALLALSLVVGVVETPDVGGILADAADSLGAWTYLAIPGLAFLETGAFVGLVLLVPECRENRDTHRARRSPGDRNAPARLRRQTTTVRWRMRARPARMTLVP